MGDLTKNFSKKEFCCPCCGEYNANELMLEVLQKMRDTYGKPMHVNSAYRCKKHNKEVDGKPTSAHLRGMAVDIMVPSSEDRYKLIYSAFVAGFARIGIANTFIHLDVDGKKPSPVMWVY